MRHTPPESVLLDPTPQAAYAALSAAYARALLYEAHLQAYTAEQVARVSTMEDVYKRQIRRSLLFVCGTSKCRNSFLRRFLYVKKCPFFHS